MKLGKFSIDTRIVSISFWGGMGQFGLSFNFSDGRTGVLTLNGNTGQVSVSTQ